MHFMGPNPPTPPPQEREKDRMKGIMYTCKPSSCDIENESVIIELTICILPISMISSPSLLQSETHRVVLAGTNHLS